MPQPIHQPEHEQPATDVPETGVGAVDEVLAGLRGLEDRPVSEHVAVFEDAHRQLRRVLDGNHDPRPDTGDGG
ncbi:MAG TPA: hypothetical protein VF728_04875 [Nocardioides sp.]